MTCPEIVAIRLDQEFAVRRPGGGSDHPHLGCTGSGAVEGQAAARNRMRLDRDHRSILAHLLCEHERVGTNISADVDEYAAFGRQCPQEGKLFDIVVWIEQ